jgi:phage-related protein
VKAPLAVYTNTDIIGHGAQGSRVSWDTLDRLRSFPEDVRRQAGHELYTVQRGADPSEWRPMPTIGAGVREIKIRGARGIYRVIYVASLADAVHVLHVFQKKSRKTSQHDLNIASMRLRQLKEP